ncbi:MAG: hypothetical protein VR68_02585 [Peptococcaceae bacterium BRH_c4a]|nr:MAG: hypothetical protein VR68_02585 [Peptococcaceae bacterium BRH_c4a]
MKGFKQEDLKQLILYDDEETRSHFVDLFRKEIDTFSTALYQAYERLEQMTQRVPSNVRSAWVHAYLFNAFNNLLNSLRLSMSGLFLPAGNLMRQYGESIAMALLCCHDKIDVFDRFLNNPDKFPVQKALAIDQKKKRLLEIDHGGWEQFREITSFFDKYSHASALALANSNKFSEPGTLIIGSGFDPDKVGAYRKEINLQISACRALFDTIQKTEHHLTKSNSS